MRIVKLVPVAALAGLAACNAMSTGPDAELGATVRNNIAVQTINPEPQYDGPAPVMGDRPALAVERYRSDKVEHPVTMKTSDVGNDSAGSGNSGGSTPK